MTHSSPDSLIELLRGRAAQQPQARAFTFLVDGETSEETITYGELDARARAIAEVLQAQHAPGSRALLLYPPGLDYIAAFFGCLYADVIAVPAYPPDPSRLERTVPRLMAIVNDAKATIALTTSPLLAMAEFVYTIAPSLKALAWVATDALTSPAGPYVAPAVDERTIAFLQYTSGSTGNPKGVVLSHGNLLHNQRLIKAGFAHDESTVVVGWLPLYHDMGLIGNMLQPLYLGVPCVLMSPISFLQRPIRWLQAISRYRATTSGGPNFAYDLCVRKVTDEERAALDLRSWRVAYNGAEPIRASTLDRFVATFEAAGFRRSSFYPCYGLAEATLIVAGSVAQTDPVERSVDREKLVTDNVAEAPTPETEVRFVSSGRPLGDLDVRIVDPDTRRPRPDGGVGEIWVKGASVARGYWGLDELSRETFHATTEAGDGPFLRTGDLGFSDGIELFITGRRKDLIILRGRNVYPQDLELSVEQIHPALRPGCGAAFSIDIDGEERVVLVHELDRRQRARRGPLPAGIVQERRAGDRRVLPVLPELEIAATGELDTDRMIEAIHLTIAQEHSVQVYAVALVRPGSIPKTSSGKIQRSATRQEFLAGRLDVLASDANQAAARVTTTRTPVSPTLRTLRELAANVLHVTADSLDPSRPLASYGLDSLGAVDLQHGIMSTFARDIPLGRLLDGPSLESLTAQIEAGPSRAPERTPRSSGVEHTETPLSYGQEALWFIDQLSPGNAAYNIACAVRIVSEVDVGALERVLVRLAERHPALRTSFPSLNGRARQQVSPHVMPFFQRAAQAESEEAVAAQLVAEADRPFDLSAGPLLRVTVLEAPDRPPILVLVIHHIVTDFWSLGVFVDELSALYRAELGEKVPPLSPLAAEYRDYVLWQRDRLAGPEADAARRYWDETLAGDLPTLELPIDRARPRAQTYVGASEVVRLRPEHVIALRRLGEAEQATLFVMMLAAFEALLHLYSGQDELLVGVPSAGRTRPEFAGVLGYFVNSLPLRLAREPNDTFRSLVGKVRARVLAALSHQEVPFSHIVARVGGERDPSRSPLFQVMFVSQQAVRPGAIGLPAFAVSAGGARAPLGGFTIESIPLAHEHVPFELSVWVAEHGTELVASFKYNADLFDASTIRQMGAHYVRFIEAAIGAPDARLRELSVLSVEEQRRLTLGWSGAKRASDGARTIHALVARQAALAPTAIAASLAGASLTYGELARRSGRLAAHLRGLGVGPEVVVGLCMERSLDMLVGLLGILEAGGAYLPLDPSYPKERLAHMVADSAATVLLTHERLVRELPAHRAQLVCLDRDWPAIEKAPDAIALTAQPDNLAYVIYTSGSTGGPKAVAVTHASAVSFLGHMQATFPVGPGDRVLQGASISFDISVREIFGTLLAGAELVLVPAYAQMDVGALLDLIEQRQATQARFVPPLLRQLLDLPDLRRRAATLKRIFTGGEPLGRELAELFRQRLSITLYNTYGPTETTVNVTHHECSAPEPFDVVPIGRPIANARLFVLDDELELAPPGVCGELYVSGLPVARGYLGRPDLTAGRFLPCPYDDAGSRMYRTGDLARWLPDGSVQFLGRRDRQVKIRGFRIELDEVEAALRALPGVERAAIITRTTPAGDTGIVGYVTGAAQAGTLRAQLAHTLPDYMIPAAIVALDAIPLTANGKLDRKALPAPEWKGDDGSYTAPATELEYRLVALWKIVLGTSSVGTHDNFFALGGHSLLAMQLVSHIRHELAVELPVRVVFDAPTVALQALHIAALSPGSFGVAPPIVPVDRRAPLTLSFAQERLWFLDRLDPLESTYNITGAIALRGELDAGALRDALADLVRRHESLRSSFVVEGGVPSLRIEEASTAFDALRVLDLGASADELATALRREAERTFDLEKGPLFRACLLRRAPAEHVLVLSMHHVVSDAWSIGVLVRELGALYTARRRGVEPRLPPLPIQYADYAAWQRRWLSGERLLQLLGYWKQKLHGAPHVLALPTDRPRRSAARHRGEVVPVVLEPALGDAVHALARSTGATPFMVLLTGFQLLLARFSGQRDLLIGTPVANRARAEVEGIVGFFANTLVLRGELAGDPTVRQLLVRTREAMLEAYAHQDLPFEKLVEALNPERSAGRTPLFQAMFAMQHVAPGGLELSDVESTPIDLPKEVAKLDLTLDLRAGPSGIEGAFELDVELFDRQTIERLAAAFVELVRGMVTAPDAKALSLPLLSVDQAHRIAHDWNQTAVELGPPRALHELFEHQADATPSAVAVVSSEARLTYAELEERANRLANRLRALGVGPESLVALFVDRSIEVVVGVLGILKAGGAYVPLDTDYPRDRLDLMLADSGASIVVARSADAERLAAAGRTVACLDDRGEEPADRPRVMLRPDNLAYAIYTSGSTGRPKGVVVSHASIVNRIRASLLEHPLSANDCVLANTPFSFDVSIWEIFAPLSSGARLAFPGEARADVRALARFMTEEHVTVTNFVPSMLTAFLEQPEAAACTTLRSILCGGEAMPSSLVAATRQVLPRTTLFNHYGPTEIAIDATRWPCERVPDGVTAPIGRPLANVEAYVLDDARALVPVGVEGELFIGGVQVARGYHARPDLTSERFVPDPFAKTPGARAYRTGDKARWLADGTLEYRGRVDHQVKVRGFRIEPGEIEAAIRERDTVADCVVVVREDQQGQPRLVAYVTGAVDGTALKAQLQIRLPAHLVPSAIVVLERLPLSPNQKIDRDALPAPERESSARVAPRTPAEVKIAALVAELLHREGVGADDDFFDLGGTSLSSVVLLARIQRSLGVALTVQDLFDDPTIAGLARALEANTSRRRTSLVALERGGTGTPLFLIHGGGGQVLRYKALARELAPHQPVYALRAAGLEEGETPLDSIEEMATRYLAEIRAAQPHGPYRLAGWSMGGMVALEMALRLEDAGEEVEQLALIDTYRASEQHVIDATLAKQHFMLDLERQEGLVAGLTDADRDRLFAVFRANDVAWSRYRPRRVVTGDTTLYVAESGPSPTLRAAQFEGVVRELKVVVVPGDHYGIIHESVRRLALSLSEQLGIVQPPAPSATM